MNRQRQGCRIIGLCLIVLFLCGCVSNVWTGAMMLYDRHNLYEKFDDYQIAASVNLALFQDKTFKRPDAVVDVAIFNNDILIAGHVPTNRLRHIALKRIKALEGYRRIYNQLAVNHEENHNIEDSWITAKIRSKILADSSIEPNDFKIITVDRIVYVMGDVKPSQAKVVLALASETSGVIRVVKLLNYYHLTKRPTLSKHSLDPN